MKKILVLVTTAIICLTILSILFSINNETINGETIIIGSEEIFALNYNNLYKGKKIIWEWEVEKDLTEPKSTLIFWIEDTHGNKVNVIECSENKDSYTIPYTSNWTVKWENPYPKTSDGLFSVELTYVIEVINKQPIASIQADVINGSASLTVSFSGKSVDYDGVIEFYQWDFDDGYTSQELNPLHTFSKTGVYLVTLTIIDNDGATGNDTIEITVT